MKITNKRSSNRGPIFKIVLFAIAASLIVETVEIKKIDKKLQELEKSVEDIQKSFENIEDHIDEIDKNLKSLQKKFEELETSEKTDEMKSFEEWAEKISEDESVSVIYRQVSTYRDLVISGKTNFDASDKLSDDFYRSLNLLIEQADIHELHFWRLDNRFDFSKVDFANIADLGFSDYNGTFDCSNFTQKYEKLSFDNTPFAVAIKILSTCDVSDASVYWSEDIEKEGDLKALLEYLIENNISMNRFTVSQYNEGEYNGISEEEFNLLSQINTSYLTVYADGFKKPLNLDLTFNDNIHEFRIYPYNTYRKINSELGNIKIRSNRKEFHCDFFGADITKNTHFSFPDSAWVDFESLNCTDTTAFYDLANVEYFFYIEDIGPGPEANLNGAIRYCSNLEYFGQMDEEDYDPWDGHKEYFYRDFNGVLKKLEENLNQKRNENKGKTSLIEEDISAEEVLAIAKKLVSRLQPYQTQEITALNVGITDLEKAISLNDEEEITYSKVNLLKNMQYFVNQTYIGFGASIDTTSDARLYSNIYDMAKDTVLVDENYSYPSYYGSNDQIGRVVDAVVLAQEDGNPVVAHNAYEYLNYYVDGYERIGYGMDNQYSNSATGHTCEGWVLDGSVYEVDDFTR